MESMRTLNHNEKRVVSFFIWDPELERKIDREVKMIDGISKLLNVATTLEQTIECNKALVLSQQRMLAYMAEIQRKQQNLLKSDNQNLEPTKATVILSDIKLPLIWTNMKARSEQKKFAVFCLVRIGSEIIDTTLKHIDKKTAEIVFNEKLIFNHVPHDFELHLEVYALNKSLALSSSAKEFANRYSYFSTYGSQKMTQLHSNHSKTPVHPQSKFILIGRTTFTKKSISKTAKVYDLKLEPTPENPIMQLPVHSSFIAKVTIQPLCYSYPSVFAGNLVMNGARYTCSLTAGYLTGEEIIRDDASNQHRFSIPIASNTTIYTCDDQLSFLIDNQDLGQEEFFVEDYFILRNWIRALYQHIIDIYTWESTLECLPSKKEQPSDGVNSLVKSSVIGTNLTKAQSSDGLHPTDIYAQSMATNAHIQVNNTDYIVDRESHFNTPGYKIRI